MKRLFAVAAALLLCGALTACGGQEKPSGAESQVSVGQRPGGELPARLAAGAPGGGGVLRRGRGSGGGLPRGGTGGFGADPAGFRGGSGLRAHLYPVPGGTFELSATFYDGTATITGTYVEEGDSYVLTPGESTAQGVVGSDVGQMTLTAGEEGYAYSGGQLGLTYDGAVFSPSQG